MRDAGTGAFTEPANPVANGGTNNQQTGLPAVPNTDTFKVYSDSGQTNGDKVSHVWRLQRRQQHPRPLHLLHQRPGQHHGQQCSNVNEGSATLVLNGNTGNISIADPDDNGASTMEVTVTVGKGTITAVGGAGGTVTGTGTQTITITGATEAQPIPLQALTITYPGNNATEQADWNGSFEVTITYNDKGNTGTRPGSLTGDTDNPRAGNGDYSYEDGTSNHLVTTRIITVTVDPVNDAPTRTTASVTLPAGTEDTDGGSGDTVSSLFGGSFSDAKDAVTDGSFGQYLRRHRHPHQQRHYRAGQVAVFDRQRRHLDRPARRIRYQRLPADTSAVALLSGPRLPRHTGRPHGAAGG